MNKQSIEIGKRVQVLNQTPSGKSFIEGFAIIRGMDYREVDGRIYCSVCFEGDSYDVYRWVNREVVS